MCALEERVWSGDYTAPSLMRSSLSVLYASKHSMRARRIAKLAQSQLPPFHQHQPAGPKETTDKMDSALRLSLRLSLAMPSLPKKAALLSRKSQRSLAFLTKALAFHLQRRGARF